MPNKHKRMIILPCIFCKCFCNSKILWTQEANRQGAEEGFYYFAEFFCQQMPKETKKVLNTTQIYHKNNINYQFEKLAKLQ